MKSKKIDTGKKCENSNSKHENACLKTCTNIKLQLQYFLDKANHRTTVLNDPLFYSSCAMII